MKLPEQTLIERVAEWIQQHRMFAPGCRVGVAVSGGADSLCLLKILLELGPRWNLHLRVLHLDHGLRGAESRADADFVRRFAADAGLACDLREVDVAARGGNLEQAARQARREFYFELLGSGAVDRVATGHTMDDQAETVLFRFLRGSGTAGLAGMRATTPEGIVRPLLELRRGEIREWLTARGIAWREDSSNAERRFARNRIRLDLLPALEREWNPALTSALAQLGKLAREEEEYWAGELQRLSGEHLRVDGGAVFISSRRLVELPTAAARRLVRRAIEVAKGDLRRMEFHHVERVLDLARKSAGHGRLLLPGLDVWRSFDQMRLTSAGEVAPASPHVVWSEADADSVGDLVDADRLGGELTVRTWHPGDAMMVAGHRKEIKLKDLFQRARVPCWDRTVWPMFMSGARVVWTRRFGVDARFAPNRSSTRVLRIHEPGYGEEIDE